ncbi:hypothetical protein SO802_027417 [Lithocarpus litseifolius]|uniref:RNase H type-1 domain-containing protein n=1 Tax=Lithocarpus litseifolius TaxID=425828 RepID=A0AAW2C500_9ROSI
MEVIAKTFTPLWRAGNGFKIQHFGDHKILFTFDNREDVDRILEGEPWSFDKHLVGGYSFQNQTDGIIIEEIKTPIETETNLKANNEEISLAEEFGGARLLGSAMSCLAWNRRGLGNLSTSKELVYIIRAKDPIVVFLAETLTYDARLDFVQRSTGFDHRWVVPRVRRSGGLVLYWRASINIIVEGLEKINKAYKAEEIEALAALKALLFAHELGFRSVNIKGDSLGLILALKLEEHSLSPVGLLVEDVKVFTKFVVRLLNSHIRRNGNGVGCVALSLVKHVIRIPDFQTWMEDVPSHIVSILQSDVVDLS